MANITRYSAFVSPRFGSVMWRVPFSEQQNNIYCGDVWRCVLNAAMQQSPGDWSHLFGPWLFSQKLIKMGSPRFMPPPAPFVSPFATSLCYCREGGEPGGENATPMGKGWGLMGHSINGDSIHEMAQWKWRFLGMFYARMSIRLGLWQGGELKQWGRECGKRQAGMLLYVLFSPSSMCYWNRRLSCQSELHLLFL